jgi:hypothetical protein
LEFIARATSRGILYTSERRNDPRRTNEVHLP